MIRSFIAALAIVFGVLFLLSAIIDHEEREQRAHQAEVSNVS